MDKIYGSSFLNTPDTGPQLVEAYITTLGHHQIDRGYIDAEYGELSLLIRSVGLAL